MSRKHPTAFERQWLTFYKLAAWDRQKFSDWLEDNPEIRQRIDKAPAGSARHIESLDAIARFLRVHRPDLLPNYSPPNDPVPDSLPVLQAASASLDTFLDSPGSLLGEG